MPHEPPAQTDETLDVIPFPGRRGRRATEPSAEVEARRSSWHGSAPVRPRPHPGAGKAAPPPIFVPSTSALDATARLAGRVAHHLNNMLTVVGGNLSLLEDALAPGQGSAEIEDIRRVCRKTSELSARLLSASGCRWSEPQAVDLRILMADLDLGRFFPDGVLFCTDSDDAPCPVLADPSHLTDLLVELVLNAREAVDGQGTVRLRVDLLPGVSSEGDPAPGWVQLEISDTGQGMTPEVLSRALHPFATLHPHTMDRGLGLAVVHGIVRQAGGSLSLVSAPGQGTTVRAWLPSTPLHAVL